MKSIYISIFVVFISISLISCAIYVPYTLQMKQKYSLSNDDVKRIQFYLSNSFELKRATPLDTKQITEDHSFKAHKGKVIDIVDFADKLEGVAKGVSDDTLDVSFEEGKWLTFIRTPADKLDAKYILKRLQLEDGNIIYDNIPFTVHTGNVHLLVIENRLSNIERNVQKASGIKLQNQ